MGLQFSPLAVGRLSLMLMQVVMVVKAVILQEVGQQAGTAGKRRFGRTRPHGRLVVVVVIFCRDGPFPNARGRRSRRERTAPAVEILIDGPDDDSGHRNGASAIGGNPVVVVGFVLVLALQCHGNDLVKKKCSSRVRKMGNYQGS